MRQAVRGPSAPVYGIDCFEAEVERLNSSLGGCTGMGNWGDMMQEPESILELFLDA